MLAANTTYTLSVDVGRGLGALAGSSVELYAGTTLIGTASYAGGDPTVLSFKTASGTFPIGGTHAR